MGDINTVEGGLSLYDRADGILQTVVQTASDHLYDIPEKQYLSTGEPVYDCEQVSVTVMRVQTGNNGPNTELVAAGFNCQVTWGIVVEIGIVRCAPVLTRRGTSSVDKLNDAFRVVSRDTHIMQEVIEQLALESSGNMSAMVLTLEPDGEFVATVAQITLSAERFAL